MCILIVRNNSNSSAVDASLLLVAYLSTQGIAHELHDSADLPQNGEFACGENAKALQEKYQMAVVLGGDGTILKTARYIGVSGVPLFGINFGRLGFLANSNEEGVVAALVAALSGDVVRECRTNLRIDVVCEGEIDPWSDEACEGNVDVDVAHRFFALNELAITRGSNGRVIDFSLGISGSHIADLRGDGLVVATATGSTAYALSAGGPLVAPGFTGLVVAPLALHTLRSRSIVTLPSDVVEVDLTQTSDARETTLFVDGDLLEFESPVKKVYVSSGSSPTILLRHQYESFYEHAAKVFF